MKAPGGDAHRLDASPMAYGLAQEKVTTLERLGTSLREALERYRQTPPDSGQREEHLAEAAEALWNYVVTREAIGLVRTGEVIRELGVPREVELRMGPRRDRSPART